MSDLTQWWLCKCEKGLSRRYAKGPGHYPIFLRLGVSSPFGTRYSQARRVNRSRAFFSIPNQAAGFQLANYQIDRQRSEYSKQV
jgi:hypothetical protein